MRCSSRATTDIDEKVFIKQLWICSNLVWNWWLQKILTEFERKCKFQFHLVLVLSSCCCAHYWRNKPQYTYRSRLIFNLAKRFVIWFHRMWWIDVSVLHKGSGFNVENFEYEARDWPDKENDTLKYIISFLLSWTWEPQALRHEGELTNRPAAWASTCRTTSFLWGKNLHDWSTCGGFVCRVLPRLWTRGTCWLGVDPLCGKALSHINETKPQGLSKGVTTLSSSDWYLCAVIGLGQLTHQSWHKGVNHCRLCS